MNTTLIVALLIALTFYAMFSALGPSATKSKRFKLYRYMVDPTKVEVPFITVVRGRPPTAFLNVVTYVPPKVAGKNGLKSHQMVGVLLDDRDGWEPENFSGNRAFKEKIHTIASHHVPGVVMEQANNEWLCPRWTLTRLLR